MIPKCVNIGSRIPRLRIIRKLSTTDGGKVAITVDPKNPKDKFYTKIENNQFNLASRITHLTPEARAIIKENPEIVEFLEKATPGKLETKNGIFELRKIYPKGFRNSEIYKLLFINKNTKKTKKYFLKKNTDNHSSTTAEAEFLAVKEFERLGFNIIKPQFATTNIKSNEPSIIVYDFTNYKTVNSALKSGKLTKKEYAKLEATLNHLQNNLQLKHLRDYAHSENVFVKKSPSGGLNLYFTDIYWEIEAYREKREEYL